MPLNLNLWLPLSNVFQKSNVAYLTRESQLDKRWLILMALRVPCVYVGGATPYPKLDIFSDFLHHSKYLIMLFCENTVFLVAVIKWLAGGGGS